MGDTKQLNRVALLYIHDTMSQKIGRSHWENAAGICSGVASPQNCS